MVYPIDRQGVEFDNLNRCKLYIDLIVDCAVSGKVEIACSQYFIGASGVHIACRVVNKIHTTREVPELREYVSHPVM
jgi:hypothetical protein